jgi:hypothetical protein
MRAVLLLLCFTFFAAPSGIAGTSTPSGLQSARSAQSLLGPETWSRILQIENSNRSSPYPKTVYALVFQFAGILWFYTEADGTQSFSLYKNRVNEEKADLSVGLRAIEEGFTRFTVMPPAASATPSRKELPNGCFIESVVSGWKRFAAGEYILEARLLMYYPRSKPSGHCVFVYRTDRGVFVIDSSEAGGPRRVASEWPSTPVALARVVASSGSAAAINTARTLDFPLMVRDRCQAPLLAGDSGMPHSDRRG